MPKQMFSLMLVDKQLISSLLKPMDEHTEDARNEEDAARLPVRAPLFNLE